MKKLLWLHPRGFFSLHEKNTMFAPPATNPQGGLPPPPHPPGRGDFGKKKLARGTENLPHPRGVGQFLCKNYLKMPFFSKNTQFFGKSLLEKKLLPRVGNLVQNFGLGYPISTPARGGTVKSGNFGRSGNFGH